MEYNIAKSVRETGSYLPQNVRRTYMKLKRCPKCSLRKRSDSFWNNKASSDGKCTYCIPCNKEVRNAYYASHPEWARDLRHREYKRNREKYLARERRKAYGISNSEYQRLLIQQGNKCALCGSPERSKRNGKLMQLAVDHCHTKGHVRGLLCMSCNNGLGRFRHDIPTIKRAIAYLNKYKK